MRYYIQDTRQFVGNSVLWWRKDQGGYTTDLKKAGKYTKKEAMAICRRQTDKAFECAYIDKIVSWHVDAQHIDNGRAAAF